MTREEFDKLWVECDESINNGDFYCHLPLFGDDTATLEGGFTADKLHQIAYAIRRLQEVWQKVDDKDNGWPKK